MRPRIEVGRCYYTEDGIITIVRFNERFGFVDHLGGFHTGYGDGVAVVVGPESTLYAAIVASVTTTLTWRAIPLSGRAVLGGKDGL